MQFTSLSILFLAFAVFSLANESATVTSTSAAFNYAPISSLLGNLVSAVATASPASGPAPSPTANLSNIADPPSNFIPVIMTAVPMSVLGDLLDPISRSSLAAEFKNGTTPSWYQSLPTSIQSYISVVNQQINSGALSANVSSAVATSTSSGLAPAMAPMATGALVVNMAGALGIAGLAMIL
ncbi:hypothetical protein BGW36DRAFT_381827 [Talaromyces proteolyticus]|uniref:Uncharacterized protein n=1 Tax=Talaromyces proteolyticus TaxID=1131652 RepID=A0AAD4PYT9_9EURO|nr:uncharacterized protein BGW36DRAFT_381827 [Talaromyces proteolyticus]KAH8694964.1 hypothetical protein BGW36DRAFT_381827 [Talaromyces proteolyticus]